MATTGVKWLTWRGPEIMRLTRQEVAQAFNETGAEGVTVIQQDWPRRTGFSANTMEVVQRATPEDLVVTWGNITASYAIWVEIGARGRAGRFIITNSLGRVEPGLRGRLRGRF